MRSRILIASLTALFAVEIIYADVSLIVDDFSSTTIIESSRFYLNQVDAGWAKKSTSLWAASSSNLTNSGMISGVPSEGAVGQTVSVNTTNSALNYLRVSFDYSVGEGSTLYFHLTGLATNGSPATNEPLGNTGAQSGKIQNQAEAEFADMSLLTGNDPGNDTADTASFGAGTSGTYSRLIALTGYTWSADESPGVSGAIGSIADFDLILAAFAANMTVTNGSGAVSIDNMELSAISIAETARPAQPNLVLLLADDLGWQDVKCYDNAETNVVGGFGGTNVFETPYLDQLATEGVKFWQAYSPACVCAPTRAAILTGKHPARNHFTTVSGGATCPQPDSLDSRMMIPYHNRRLELEDVTLPEMLGAYGYYNGHIGKWHLAGPDPVEHGFDYSEGDRGATRVIGDRTTDFATDLDENGFAYDQTTENALEFLDLAVATNKPFFCYYASYLVHAPIHIRTESLLIKYAAKMGYSYPLTGAEFFAPGQNNPYYAAMVEMFDYNIYRIMTYLRETDDPRWPGHKLIENTYIFLTSDNGGMEQVQEYVTDNYPLDEGKIHQEEGGTRVPFFAMGPGISSNLESDVMINGLDFMPTMLSLAGIPVPAGQDGCDLSTLLLNDPQDDTLVTNDVGEVRDTMYWHYPHGSRMYTTMRKGRWKIFRNYDYVNNPENNSHRLYELYSTNGIRVDIEETVDLWDADPAFTAGLAAEMDAWLAEVDAHIPSYNPNYTGTLPNQGLVPGVITNGHNAGVVWVEYETNNAAMARVDLIYTLNGESASQEWFEKRATIITPGRAEVEVPEGTTHYVFNLIDENNFLVSYPDVGTSGDGFHDSVFAFVYADGPYVDPGPQDAIFSEDFSSATLGVDLLRDSVGFRKGSSSAWMIDSGKLSNTSLVNSTVSEGAAAFILNLSVLASNVVDRVTLSFDWTMAEPNEMLCVHIWGYVNSSSTPTSPIMILGASNGNAWEKADPIYMTAYNFGNSNGVFNGTPGDADDAAISFLGSYAVSSYARTFDLSDWTTAPNTLNAYDYLAVGFTRIFGGTAPAVTIDNVKVTVPTSNQYVQWAYDSGLEDPAMTNNPDGDALDNLAEYALGGDPTNGSDIGYIPTAGTTAEGGTNFFEYVHARRITPGHGLLYAVESTDDLVSGNWTNSGAIELPAVGYLAPDFEAVTNRIDTSGKTNEFIRLKIEAL